MGLEALGAIMAGVGGLAGGVGSLARGSSSTSQDLAPNSWGQNASYDQIYGKDKNAGERARLQKLLDDDDFNPVAGYSQNGGEDKETVERKLAALKEDRGGGLQDEITRMVNAGPGMQDVTKSLGSQRGLATLLEQMAKSGGLPSAEDIGTSNTLAGGLFNARRTAQAQTFEDLGQENARMAARLGRDGLDPILAAKLGTTKARMSDSLQAEQSDFANKFALNLPGQRLGYARDAAQVDAGLAAQAQQNRATLLGLGSQLLGAERNYQLGAAGKTTSSTAGFGEILGGAFGGAGAGLNLFSAGQKLFSGQGGGGGNQLSQQIASYNPLPSYSGFGGSGAPSGGGLSDQIKNFSIGI